MTTATAVQVVVALFSSGGLVGGIVYALRFRSDLDTKSVTTAAALLEQMEGQLRRSSDALERANEALERSTRELEEAREHLRKNDQEIDKLRDRLTDAMSSRQALQRENAELRERVRRAEARVEELERRVEQLDAR